MAMDMNDEPSWLKSEKATVDTVDWEDPNKSTQKKVADTGSAYDEAKKVRITKIVLSFIL